MTGLDTQNSTQTGKPDKFYIRGISDETRRLLFEALKCSPRDRRDTKNYIRDTIYSLCGLSMDSNNPEGFKSINFAREKMLYLLGSLDAAYKGKVDYKILNGAFIVGLKQCETFEARCKNAIADIIEKSSAAGLTLSTDMAENLKAAPLSLKNCAPVNIRPRAPVTAEIASARVNIPISDATKAFFLKAFKASNNKEYPEAYDSAERTIISLCGDPDSKVLPAGFSSISALLNAMQYLLGTTSAEGRDSPPLKDRDQDGRVINYATKYPKKNNVLKDGLEKTEATTEDRLKAVQEIEFRCALLDAPAPEPYHRRKPGPSK
jgi:hypothetical protein